MLPQCVPDLDKRRNSPVFLFLVCCFRVGPYVRDLERGVDQK